MNPGGLAADGASLEDAHTAFRKTLTSVLFDLAGEAETFSLFKVAVEEFFNETNEPTLAEWQAAVDEVRKSDLSVEGIPREPAESPVFVNVVIKEQREFSAACNVLEPPPDLLATAA